MPCTLIKSNNIIPAAMEFKVKFDFAKKLPIRNIEKNMDALTMDGLAFAIKQ